MDTQDQAVQGGTLTAAGVRGRLAGKAAVITGGSTGIGYAAALAFVREGARVLVIGRDAEALGSAAATLREEAAAAGLWNAEVLAEAADVTRSEDLERAMEAARAAFGGIDVLFVNAGIGAFAPLELATETHFDAIFGTNVRGAFFTVQKALPMLNPGASVILNGSVNGQIGMAGASVYSASKAAVRSLARTLSAELKERGVRVNVISPGPVVTPIYQKLGLSPEALEATEAGIRAMIPIGRFGQPGEIADAVVFLASDESTFLLGAELVADGGLSQL